MMAVFGADEPQTDTEQITDILDPESVLPRGVFSGFLCKGEIPWELLTPGSAPSQLTR